MPVATTTNDGVMAGSKCVGTDTAPAAKLAALTHSVQGWPLA